MRYPQPPRVFAPPYPLPALPTPLTVDCTAASDHFSPATCCFSAWQYQLSISITAIFRASKRAVPHMAATGGGSIVNMARCEIR